MEAGLRAVGVTLALIVCGIGGAFLFGWLLPAGMDGFPVMATLLVGGVTYYASQISRRMAVHFREIREGEFRPYVTAEIEKPDDGSVWLVVRSFGRGMAKDVQIRLTERLNGPDGEGLDDLPLFRETVSHLPPDRRLCVLLRAGHDDAPDLPPQIPLRIAYRDYFVPGRDFEERLTLQPSILQGVSSR